MSGPEKCNACGSKDRVRHFQIVVASVPLRVQPMLCGACGDAYLLRIGAALGEVLRERGKGSVR